SKTEEFQSRMELWRRSNDMRRLKATLQETLFAFPRLFMVMIGSLFSKWHLKWALGSALIGFSIASIQGQDWEGIGAWSALFASVPAALLIGGFGLITPLLVYVMMLHHFSVHRTRKKWKREGSPFRKNLAALLPFFDETKPMERLVKAEGHRQLGQFSEALTLIEQGLPEHLHNYSLTLKTLCERKNDQFIYRDSFKEATDETALAFKSPTS
ncbi:MAG: hypothetical protein P1V97_12450, partial [Planctomycetota bacterium]|nr:hypothetical protein [Planctomycetota bacterium]